MAAVSETEDKKGGAASLLERMLTLKRTDPGEFWFRCLFWTFWVHLLFYSIGYGFREVMPPLCAIFLCLYYRYNWKNSVLARLPVWPLFFCLWIMLLIGIVFSIDPKGSLLEVGTASTRVFCCLFWGWSASEASKT